MIFSEKSYLKRKNDIKAYTENNNILPPQQQKNNEFSFFDVSKYFFGPV